jgi:hypothetical protein
MHRLRVAWMASRWLMRPPGDVFAVHPVVSRLAKNDRQPGVPPETRRIAGGAIVLIMPIAADHMLAAGAQLVLRCEPDGRTLVAINRTAIDSSRS